MKHITFPGWMIEVLPVTDIPHVLHEIEVHHHVRAMIRVQDFKRKAYKIKRRQQP